MAFLERRSRGARVAIGAALLATALGAADAAAQRSIADRVYDCRIVASTREFPWGVDQNGAPGMNAWGQVAFFAESRTEAGERVTELRVGRGDTDSEGVPRTHAVARAGRSFAGDPLGPFDTLHEAVIEDAARVVFRASDPPTGGPPGTGIYRVFTDHPVAVKPGALYATEAIGGSFLNLGEIHAANPRHVVFSASTGQGFAYYRDGQIVARNGDDGIQVVSSPVLIHPFQPWLAFTAVLDDPMGGGAVVVDGSRYDEASGFEAAFRGISIGGSAFAIVAYTRSGIAGIDTWELVRHNGLGAAVFVDGDEDPFEFFAEPRETSVNTRGDVAFISSPTGDGDTLLVADGGDVIHRVVCDDMFAIFGTIVFFDLALSARGMNGDGQIAFLARAGGVVPETGENPVFLVRADPRPGQGAPPTSCIGLADGTSCDDGDPVTVAACANDECIPDPVNGPPTSCLGQPEETVCDDGDPGTISFCVSGECVGIPLPVPEASASAAAPIAAAALYALRRRRTSS
jgi:hypothetical protein